MRAICAPALSRLGRRRFAVFIARATQEDLTVIGKPMESGQVSSVIDRRYRLREVPEAIRYVEHGHARGKVTIIVDGDGAAG